MAANQPSALMTLPLPIIEQIAIHTSGRILDGMQVGEICDPLKFLYSHSREWYHVLRMLCSRSATLLFTDLDVEDRPLAIGANLQKLVDLKQHGYVRRVRLRFNLYQLCLDETVIVKLRKFFNTAGRMYNVRELEIWPWWEQGLASNSPHSEGPLPTESDDAIRGKNISDLMCLMREYMPQVSNMVMYGVETRWGSVPSSKLSVDAIAQLSKIVQSPLKLITYKYSINRQILAQAQSCLRHVEITKHTKGQCHVDLIRSNAQTLESIYIEKATFHAMEKITLCPGSSNQTLVYPQLKSLRIITSSGKRSNKMRKFLISPFPELEEFEVQGQFPFTSALFLKENRKSLRVLKLEVDESLMIMLDDLGTAEPNFFPNLECISMRLPLRHRYLMGGLREPLFTKTMTISKNLKVAKLHDVMRINPDVLLAPKCTCTSLQVLDMTHTSIMFSHAVQLLGSLPNVTRAGLSLDNDRTHGSMKLLPEEYINECRKTLQVSNSRLRSLGIFAMKFPTVLKGGEYLLLMAELIPSLQRVSLYPESKEEKNYRTISHLPKRLKRKIFQDSRAHNVEYLISRVW
ncbi:hypothetical protein EC988_001152 [Linderina pennispora]|nr:hypothetical protein EC988_001152 [Linderina pennispora]